VSDLLGRTSEYPSGRTRGTRAAQRRVYSLPGAVLAARHEVCVRPQRETSVRMTRVLRHGLDRFAGVEQPARLEVPKRVGAVVPTRLYLSHDERVLAQTVAEVSIERRPQEGAEVFSGRYPSQGWAPSAVAAVGPHRLLDRGS
jgi:hypothetical protein